MRLITRSNLTLAIVAALAVLAAFALMGHPLIPPEALAGLGMVPMAMSGEVTMADVKTALEKQGDTMKEWCDRKSAEIVALNDIVRELAIKTGRPNLCDPSALPHETAEQKDLMRKAVRALLVGDKSKADALFVEAKALNVGTGPEGGYVVSTQFSSGFTKVMQEVSPVYRLARVIPLDPGADGFEEPVDRETADANWVGEQTPRPETDTPDLGMFYVPLREIYAMPKPRRRSSTCLRSTSWNGCKRRLASRSAQRNPLHFTAATVPRGRAAS